MGILYTMPRRSFKLRRPRLTRRGRGMKRTRAGVVKRFRRVPRLVAMGQPRSRLVRLRYVTNVNLDPAIGVTASNVYRANSIFDPDQTGIGHQPMGHDEWNAFYTRYTVVSSKITCAFYGSGTTGIVSNAVCGIHVDNDTSLTASTSELLEQNRSKWRYLAQPNGNKGVTIVTKTFSAKKFFGVSQVRDNDDLGAAFGSNPTRPAYFQVFVGPVNGTHNISDVDTLVTIDYIVLLQSPRDVSQS